MMYLIYIATLFSIHATTCETFTASKKTYAKFTYWGFSVYDMEYSADSAFPKEPFLLELKYKRSLSGLKIAERSQEEMLKIGGPESKVNEWTVTMKSIFPDVKAGDSIRGFVDKDKKSYFCKDGKLLGTIADPEFADYFFGIWLSEKTTRPDLRKKLLEAFNETKNSN